MRKKAQLSMETRSAMETNFTAALKTTDVEIAYLVHLFTIKSIALKSIILYKKEIR